MLLKNKTLIILTIISALTAGGTAYAQTSANAVYNAADESITVTVDTDNKSRNATLTVEKDGVFYAVAEFERTSKDNFSCTCSLPPSCSSGRYTAKITIGGETAVSEFDHINKKNAETAMEIINGASESSFDSALQQTYDKLAVDMTEYAKYKDKIKKIYFLHKPARDLTSAEFSAEYGKALSLSIASEINNNDEFDTYLKNNAQKIGFDYAKYEDLSNDEKEEIRGRIRNTEYTEKQLADDYKIWFCLADINAKTDASVSTYRDGLLVTYKDLLKLDTAVYSKSSNKDDIIRKVMKTKYNSLNDIQNAFYKAVSEYPELSPQGGAGGGASGGASGGNKNTYQPVAVPAVPTQTNNSVYIHNFDDVNDSFWGAKAINYLYERKILNGVSDRVFMPDNSVTRAEFAKIIISALNIKANSDSSADFKDVNENDWFCKYVKAASDNGIIFGNNNGEFLPYERITRQDMAVIIYRAAKGRINLADVSEMQFSDANDISDYAVEAVSSLVNSGILNGVDTYSFAPYDTVTRAQAAKATYEMLMLDITE